MVRPVDCNYQPRLLGIRLYVDRPVEAKPVIPAWRRGIVTGVRPLLPKLVFPPIQELEDGLTVVLIYQNQILVHHCL